ncbi:Fe(3+) ABC transporter substrate-binding protein [Rhodohalobacter sp. 614A]|uniref:Fe(3+) ABC transporter substrate-binding protein n=1 Tax=Rhodohalobacter sp. 614A TaxID=2908649 RepID=UPI001F2C1E97|nr:Fe(3+) ABC transporter substrate-binding protein [Rhodohalobacter sp. 614A]
MITHRHILFIIAGFLFFISCSDEEVVNIYSSRHYDTDLQLYENFTEKTGIAVNLIEGSSDELIERINNEGINSPADVVITVDAGRLWRAKEAGVLQSFESDYLSETINDQMHDPEGYWVGLSKRVRGIVYNKEAVDTTDLEGYWELADDQWNGRICMRSSNNIYNQSLVASLIETYGEEETEEWATNLVNNFARSPQGGDTDQIQAVAAGLCDIAIVNHYYLARLIRSDSEEDREVASQVAMYFPADEHGGAHVNISGAGVAANSPNKENAIRFIEYLATEEAQQYYAIANNEFPVLTTMELPEVLGQFGNFDTDGVNVAMYGINNPTAIRVMDRAGWR